MIALQTKNLTKYFGGVHAVEGLSLTISQGSITSIIGPNGSGKTTLMNLLCGLIPWDSGSISIGGQMRHRLRAHEVARLGITKTFQEVRVFEQMSVLDNILVVLTARPIFAALFDRHTHRELARAKEVLMAVGLWEKRTALAKNCSYGQRKLLEIARLLAMNAEILLFDEPYAGLFPQMRTIVTTLIRELKAKGKTVILIEHDMPLIRELADYVIVMDSGKLLAEGKPDEVLARREVIEAYLGE